MPVSCTPKLSLTRDWRSIVVAHEDTYHFYESKIIEMVV
jgi:hypothetical protein